MKNPFIYGMEVSGDAFCNRKDEIKEISRDIKNSHNVILFSQRRFGKTSLIKEVFRACRKKGIVTIYVDLYPVLCEEKFIQIYAKAIAESIHGTLAKGFKGLGEFFRRLRPSVSYDDKGQMDFSFSIDSDNIPPSLEDVLESVKRYADRKNKKVAVCFDEFQQLGFFGTDLLEKTMRSSFQKHSNISYIFMGSKKHLIQDIFNNPHRPFYRSGKSFPLEKIKQEELSAFIADKFKATGKRISFDLIKSLIEACEAHPYYVQFLSHIIWEKTIEKKKIEQSDVTTALELLIKRETATYQAAMDGLSLKQKQVIIALAKKTAKDKVLSMRFLKKHNLPSVSTVQYILNNLVDKDLIDRENGNYIVSDVFFKKWLSQL
ncbi:MAG: ATP-binding protein [Candidatus Omnitrophica bacterium]|nr:ATP-binding protein [Candidatus Omnitrophota bacterium]MBU0878542.1 ATP-binding protein [Candidatus Omnitrophota bacterium]MBU0896081.1 ATP-binding protein [Candidatus Omnitrophota bacterium]MBU1134081.1 ATP-binding protein [Candidatus Omnitrophota bacterium]MBU1367469.1 ATP-binding protein [Candidatus Omnitrophota bacterium]